MEDYVRRFRYKATKAKQAQSRLKAIERMARLPGSRGFPFDLSSPCGQSVRSTAALR